VLTLASFVVAITVMLKQMRMFTVASFLALLWGASITQSNPCNAAELSSFPLIPHHIQKARRLKEDGLGSSEFEGRMLEQDDNSHRLRRRTEAVQMGALYNGYGTHYVDLWCGTPPQRQTVIVDTGSAVTAFPCSDCDRCGPLTYHVDNLFQEAESSTFSIQSCDECERGSCSDDDQCIINMYYEEDSYWSAVKARDRCYIGGPHNAALVDEVSGTDSIDPEHAKALTIDLESNQGRWSIQNPTC